MNNRLTCLKRVLKYDLTGKKDYNDPYAYLIHDNKTGNQSYIAGRALRDKMQKGLKVGNLKFTADGRIYVENARNNKNLQQVYNSVSLSEILFVMLHTSLIDKTGHVTQIKSKDQIRLLGEKDKFKTDSTNNVLEIRNMPVNEMERLASRAMVLSKTLKFYIRDTPVVVCAIGNIITIVAPDIRLSPIEVGVSRGLNILLDTISKFNIEELRIIGLTSVSSDLSFIFWDDNHWRKEKGLKKLVLQNTDLSKVTSLEGAFMNIHLESIEIIGTTLDSVKDMTNAFRGTKCLKKLEIPSVNNVQYMDGLFAHSGYSIDVNSLNWIMSDDIKDMACAFTKSSAINIDLSHLNIKQLENMHSIAADCESLKTFKLGNTDTPNLETMENAFYNCSELEYVDIGALTSGKLLRSSLEKVRGLSYEGRTEKMFAGVNKKLKLNISDELVAVIKKNMVH
jgi:hypothetical protein